MPIRDISRRSLIGGTIAAASVPGVGRASAQPAGAVRIGVIQSLSGPQGDIGKAHLLGAQLAAKEVNESGGIDGRQIELVVRDTRFDANTAIGAVHELVGDGINLIHGEAFSAPVFAVLPVLSSLGAVNISPSVIGMDATHDKFTRYFFRCTPNGHMVYGGEAILMSKKAPTATRWSAIVEDALGNRLGWQIFSTTLKHAYPKFANREVKVNDPVLVKPGALDFRSAISQVVGQDPDGVMVCVSGGDEITCLEQARPFGLLQKVKIAAETSQIAVIGPALKGGTPPNLWGFCLWYYDYYKALPLAQRFYRDIVAITHKPLVDPFSAQGHTVIMSFAAAVRAAGSTGTEAVIAALETQPFDSIFGSLRYRKEDHQLLANPGYLRIDPQAAEPGFKATEYLTIPWQEMIEPASPGIAFKEE